ncbi:MAG: hypothetical protein IPL53_16800 [Ignavibacteria bacterium]|nr:hypothetical protein [Ignavibacteria bacterium]
MEQTLLTILGISVIVAIPTSMIVLSIEAGRPNLKKLFSDPSMLIRYFLVMFILIPALALLCFIVDPGHQTVWIAVIVISLTPASPGMLKNVTKLGGDFNMCIAWMITAIFLSLIMLPINLFTISQILNINIDLGIDDVTLKLFLMFILPLLAGFLIKRYLPALAPSIGKALDLISKIASVVLMICLLIIAVPVVINNDITEILLISLFLIISLSISHFMELPEKKYGPILSYSVILRLPAPAFVLASINGKAKIYAPEIFTFLILGLILMAVYGKIFYRKKASKS